MAKSFHDLSPRSQLIVFGLLSVLAAGGAWQVLLSPMYGELGAARGQLETVRQDIVGAQAIAAKLPAARREVEELEAALRLTTAVIPEEKDPQDVLRHLHQLASLSQVEISKFTPKPVVAKAQYTEWPIELSFEGGYHELGVFFDHIASVARLMSVADLSVRTQVRPNARGSVTATCTATTFVFRHDAPPAPGGRP